MPSTTPLLGPHLLSQAKAKLASSSTSNLSFSSTSIDEAIGGIQHGTITGIQCDVGGYGTLLAYHIISSQLLLCSSSQQGENGDESKTSQIAYIDTTGAFSPLNLLKVLMYRLQLDATRHPNVEIDGAEGGEGKGEGMGEYKTKAAELLDKVQYMRAFDFDGVMEAVGEVALGIVKGDVEGEQNIDIMDEVKVENIKIESSEKDEEGSQEIEAGKEEGKEIQVSKEEERGELEMSMEDEDEDTDIIPDSEADSEDEIYWPIPVPPKYDPGFRKKKNKETPTEPQEGEEEVVAVENPQEDVEMDEQEEDGKDKYYPPDSSHKEQNLPPQALGVKRVDLLIIDSISRPIEALAEKNEVITNVTLTTLSRTLKSLARDNNMAILLLSAPVHHQAKLKEHKKSIYVKNTSIFAKIIQTDGLPVALNYSLDLSIMVSRYPHDEMTAHRRRSGGQERYILEVISQRYGTRAGQWGVFTVKDGVELVDAFSDEREHENLDHLLTENERRGKGAFGRWSRD
ncbi:hypothetical protein TWF694_005589 [Orbilia ellipsospora]|uniref:DNA recombination and repair protein Rad51-like C-terminal domain-containing protein n=1 Tax=Orbilia ellipsospora TaxID=2528407 RepID=A0AAV9WTS7_9PEZI